MKTPAGAARVGLSGKTVMPALIDTHTHLSRERAALIETCSAGRTMALVRR